MNFSLLEGPLAILERDGSSRNPEWHPTSATQAGGICTHFRILGQIYATKKVWMGDGIETPKLEVVAEGQIVVRQVK
jgi:hypothetical protein